MKAKYATSCVECSDRIKPGKEIVKNTSGNWVHSYCVENKLKLP